MSPITVLLDVQQIVLKFMYLCTLHDIHYCYDVKENT